MLDRKYCDGGDRGGLPELLFPALQNPVVLTITCIAVLWLFVVLNIVGPQMIQAGETPDAEAVIRELAQRVPQHENELMTIAQQLEEKGREKGRQEGLEIGLEKGRQPGGLEASREIARNLLANGMDSVSVMKMTGLSEEELQQIRH